MKSVEIKNEKLSHPLYYFIDCFEQNGLLASISFLFKDNTVISLEDIAAIDKQIKESIQATFTGTNYRNFDVIIYPGITIGF